MEVNRSIVPPAVEEEDPEGGNVIHDIAEQQPERDVGSSVEGAGAVAEVDHTIPDQPTASTTTVKHVLGVHLRPFTASIDIIHTEMEVPLPGSQACLGESRQNLELYKTAEVRAMISLCRGGVHVAVVKYSSKFWHNCRARGENIVDLLLQELFQVPGMDDNIVKISTLGVSDTNRVDMLSRTLETEGCEGQQCGYSTYPITDRDKVGEIFRIYSKSHAMVSHSQTEQFHLHLLNVYIHDGKTELLSGVLTIGEVHSTTDRKGLCHQVMRDMYRSFTGKDQAEPVWLEQTVKDYLEDANVLIVELPQLTVCPFPEKELRCFQFQEPPYSELNKTVLRDLQAIQTLPLMQRIAFMMRLQLPCPPATKSPEDLLGLVRPKESYKYEGCIPPGYQVGGPVLEQGGCLPDSLSWHYLGISSQTFIDEHRREIPVDGLANLIRCGGGSFGMQNCRQIFDYYTRTADRHHIATRLSLRCQNILPLEVVLVKEIFRSTVHHQPSGPMQIKLFSSFLRKNLPVFTKKEKIIVNPFVGICVSGPDLPLLLVENEGDSSSASSSDSDGSISECTSHYVPLVPCTPTTRGIN